MVSRDTGRERCLKLKRCLKLFSFLAVVVVDWITDGRCDGAAVGQVNEGHLAGCHVLWRGQRQHDRRLAVRQAGPHPTLHDDRRGRVDRRLVRHAHRHVLGRALLFQPSRPHGRQLCKPDPIWGLRKYQQD